MKNLETIVQKLSEQFLNLSKIVESQQQIINEKFGISRIDDQDCLGDDEISEDMKYLLEKRKAEATAKEKSNNY